MNLFHQRVYVHHTDYLGVVYYANYFIFAEYARAELLRDQKLAEISLNRESPSGFVVTHLESHFRKPAFLNDQLTIQTHIISCQKIKLVLSQAIVNAQKELLFEMVITLAWTKNLKITSMPQAVHQQIALKP